jgi:uncharacterized protein (DUF2267 family)
MLVRGIYYEGWDPSRVPVKMRRDEFFDRVRHGFPYDVPGGVEAVTRVVLETLRRRVTDGEWADIVSTMPKDLAATLS